MIMDVCAKCGGTGIIGDGPTSFNRQKCTCRENIKSNTMEWISVNTKLPPLENGEPIECSLRTDLDGEDEFQDGYYEDGTWWITLCDPFVGHQDIRTFSIDFNVTHWMPKIV